MAKPCRIYDAYAYSNMNQQKQQKMQYRLDQTHFSNAIYYYNKQEQVIKSKYIGFSIFSSQNRYFSSLAFFFKIFLSRKGTAIFLNAASSSFLKMLAEKIRKQQFILLMHFLFLCKLKADNNYQEIYYLYPVSNMLYIIFNKQTQMQGKNFKTQQIRKTQERKGLPSLHLSSRRNFEQQSSKNLWDPCSINSQSYGTLSEPESPKSPSFSSLCEELNEIVGKATLNLKRQILDIIQRQERKKKRNEENFNRIIKACQNSLMLFQNNKLSIFNSFSALKPLENLQKESKIEQSPLESFESSKILSKDRPKKIKHWTSEQNKVYLQYLEEFPEKFETSNRRKCRTFKQLSNRLEGVRDCHQCRGHHKKMVEKYHTIDNIIKVIRLKIWNQENREQPDEEDRPDREHSQRESIFNVVLSEIDSFPLPGFYQENESFQS